MLFTTLPSKKPFTVSLNLAAASSDGLSDVKDWASIFQYPFGVVGRRDANFNFEGVECR
jgi:hypothetical protein